MIKWCKSYSVSIKRRLISIIIKNIIFFLIVKTSCVIKLLLNYYETKGMTPVKVVTRNDYIQILKILTYITIIFNTMYKTKRNL